jgi:hypothetical protein
MLRDLESIHSCLIEAFKSVLLINGIDIDSIIAKDSSSDDNSAEPPYGHLPI